MKTKMHPLKSDHCYAVLDAGGMVAPGLPGVVGFFLHDTRHLSNYCWDMSGMDLIHSEEGAKGLTQYWSRFADHEQLILVRRNISLRPDGFDDELIIENSGQSEQGFTPILTFDADFVDVFETRGWKRIMARGEVERAFADGKSVFRYQAQDGAKLATYVGIDGGQPGQELKIAPRASHVITVSAHFTSSISAATPPRKRINWVSPDLDQVQNEAKAKSLARACADIETLALSTPNGTCIAAGIPNFVVMFGRDSLITAWFLLKQAPDLARGVLKFLAHHQGSKNDAFRDEQPGKILHEYREGEISRLNELPFAPYFGNVDATALFVRVLADYVQTTGDKDLARELAPNWRNALAWIENERDGRGLLKYTGSADGKGLINKCWKDSADSMSYSDGTLPDGPLSVIEVQGYVYAAFDAGAYLNDAVNADQAETGRLIALRDQTSEAIERHFWLEEQQIYALALDNDGRPLDIVSSNPGHLLWSGAVPGGKAGILIERMFQNDLWSGWGLRTLATGEARYNPLSYHNGSIWPHDTALFGAGLYRYGRKQDFAKVSKSLLDLANVQHDLRLPELVSGYERDGGIPPLPYVESCRPQAWAAAALIYMLHPHGETNQLPGRMENRHPGQDQTRNAKGSILAS